MRQVPAMHRPLMHPKWGRGFSSVPIPKHAWSANFHTGSQYTCPTGKKAIVGWLEVYNPQAGAITLNGYIGSAIAANQWMVNLSVATVATLALHQGFLLNAGDTYNVTASAQCNGFVRIWEFPASEPIVGVKTASINGTTTIYTCPAGKTATMILPTFDCFGGFGCNTTGGAINMNTSFTPSGGSAGRMSSVQSLAAGGVFYFPFQFMTPALSAGQSVGFTANATGINVWTVWCEMEL